MPRPGRARDGCRGANAFALRGLGDRGRHRADHDRHRAAGRSFRRLQHFTARGWRLRPQGRHRRIRQWHQHRALPDCRVSAGDDRRSHPSLAIRHRAWRPRHRRLWQRRDLRRRARDAGGGRGAGKPTEAIRGVIVGREPGYVHPRQPCHGLCRTPHPFFFARSVRTLAGQGSRRQRQFVSRAPSLSMCRAFALP